MQAGYALSCFATHALIWLTATGTATADACAAFPAVWVFRVAPVNGFTADGALVAIPAEAAVATGKFTRFTIFRDNMDRAADQAESCHLRFVSNAVPLPAVVIEQLFCRVSVKWFHIGILPGLDLSNATLLPDLNCNVLHHFCAIDYLLAIRYIV